MIHCQVTGTRLLRIRFAILCMCGLLIVASGCDKKGRDSSTSDGPGKGGVERQITVDHIYWVELWGSAASKERITRETFLEVRRVLQEELGPKFTADLQTVVTPGLDKRLEASMDNFAAAYAIELKGAQNREGIARWLAFCILECSKRIKAQQVIPEAVRINHREMCEFLKAAMLKKHRERAGSQHWEKWKNLIEGEADRFEEMLTERIRVYQNDILCPAFRLPVNSKTLEAIVPRNLKDIPFYVEPLGHIGPNRAEEMDKEYAVAVRSFTAIFVSECLIEIFSDEIKQKIRGTFYFSGQGSTGGPPKRWPMIVKLRPRSAR